MNPIHKAIHDSLRAEGYCIQGAGTISNAEFSDIYCISCRKPIGYFCEYTTMETHLDLTVPKIWGGTGATVTVHQYNDPNFISNIANELKKIHHYKDTNKCHTPSTVTYAWLRRPFTAPNATTKKQPNSKP